MSALAIARRELASLFAGPGIWSLLALFQAALGFVFVFQVWNYERVAPELAHLPGAPGLTALVVAPLFKTASFVMLLAAPLVTMNLVAGERQAGTWPLLVCAPVGAASIVAGKYLAALAILGIMLGQVAMLALSLLAGGRLDTGLLLSGLTGVTLLAALYAALGLYVSALMSRPSAAAFATFGVLFVLWLAGSVGATGESGPVAVLGHLSLAVHLDHLLQGVFDTADVSFFVLLTALCLFLATHHLDGEGIER